MRVLIALVLIPFGGWLLWRQASGISGDAAVVAAHRGDLAALRRTEPRMLEEPRHPGDAPLVYYAIWGEQPEAIELLLEKGADANSAWSDYTPLGAAAGTDEPAVVRVLLEHDADPDAGCPAGWTPLMLSIARGDATSARLLLDAGADASAVNNAGFTAADIARRRPHDEELIALIASATHDDRTSP